MELPWGDIRLAWRQIRRRPVWSLAIIVVLAVGIGGNSAMYAGFEAWVLRPLDFEQPEELVAFTLAHPASGRARSSPTPSDLADWRQLDDVFTQLGAYRRTELNLEDTTEPARVRGARVSANLFPLLGKHPVLGRDLSPTEDRPGSPSAVVLISDDLWSERFARDPAVLGQTVRLDGLPHEILGVMEPGFAFPEWADVWTPLGLDVTLGKRSEGSIDVIGRLASGATPQAAELSVRQLEERLEPTRGEAERGWRVDVRPLRTFWVPQVIEVALMTSMGAALFVLLVICANVGGLVLAKAASRQREYAVRSSLGASRGRLAVQGLVETTMLALGGGLLGVPVAQVMVGAMLHAAPIDPPYLFTMSFSPQAGAFTFLVALLAGLACGWIPFSNRRDFDRFESLKGGARIGESRRLSTARSLLVAGELALSTALLIGALLMVKSFVQQRQEVSGFATSGVVSTEIGLTGLGFEEASERRSAVAKVLTQLEQERNLEASGIVSRLMTSPGEQWLLAPRGADQERHEGMSASLFAATSGYLDALGMSLVEGRWFTANEDLDGAEHAVVSRALANQLWPSGSALGRQVRRASQTNESWWTVVGVVEDVRLGRDMVSGETLPSGQFYIPWVEHADPFLTVAARSVLPAQAAAEALREALREAVPAVPVGELLTIEESILRAGWTTRFFGAQLAQYAVFAMLIAAIGLYGLISDSVNRRAHELATRAAFGAQRRDLVWLILKQASRLGVIGVLLGLGLAALGARLGQSMLVGVLALDPAVYGAVGLALLATTLVAALVPALKASRADPVLALRSE